MKKAVFVLGSLEYEAVRQGEAMTDDTLQMLDKIADGAGVQAELVFVMQDPLAAGRSKTKLGIRRIRAERPRVLQEIGEAAPELVVCLGPVASACVFDKGNLVEGEVLRREHRPLGEHGPPVFVTFGLENVRFAPGLRKWLAMDIAAASAGWGETVWGSYILLLPGTEEWSKCPADLEHLLPGRGVA